MEKRDLGSIATEIGGIAHTLMILSTALDPHEEFEHHPQAYCMSLFALAEYCSRLQDKLDDAHDHPEVKPLNQAA